MVTTYSYSVSSAGPTTTIQAVIDRIAEEIQSFPIVERDIEVLVAKGNYPGFTIPDAMLFPLFNTSYKLIIRGEPSTFPIIDFNYSSEDQNIGIDVGSGNPNVRIENLRVQYFSVGIRFGLNSHYPVVKNCIINNNRNAGIFFEQTSEAQAIQNVIINGDYGIVCRLTKSAILIHNTIFMNGAISSIVGKSVSCIWAELANDYGAGTADSGVLHMIGNLAWNTSGRCLTLFTADIERPGAIVSNYNDWVVGNPSEFIVAEDNAFYSGANSSPRRTFTSLTQWKQLGKDLNSKSEDPRFISAVKVRSKRNGYAVDLNLLPISPVLGMVPSFPYISSSILPSYFDVTEITKDILRNNRNQSNTAAGANEKVSTSGFFGQDVFSNPLDLDLVKKCGVSPFDNILLKSLDLWFPSVAKGYFYSREREYYLYAKKRASYLGELANTTFVLPAPLVINKEIKILVNGKRIDYTYYEILGNKLTLLHKDLNIVTGDEEISIEGYISNWSGSFFNYNKILYRFKINEGITKFYLPEDYVNSGPVVITDDITYPTDSDYTSNREYAVSFDQEVQKSEITFSNYTNQITNGQFDYTGDSSEPLFWKSSLAKVVYSTNDITSVAGTTVCALEDKGYLSTIVSVSTGNPSNFSFHTMSPGSGVANWRIEYYDTNYDTLGIVNTGSISLKPSWSRYNLFFNSTGTDFDTMVPQVPYPCIPLNTYAPPTRAAYADIKLEHRYNPAYTGQMFVDAIMFENTTVPSLYHRKPMYNELTVEYETSESDNYIDTHLSMSPVTNQVTDGFLFIPEIPASTYGGPTSPAVTTLHEWRWPEGRRTVMPWARTKGKDKLRKRPLGRFNLIPQLKPESLSPVGLCSSIDTIDLIPSRPATFVGDTNGIGITLIVTDTDNNPAPMLDTKVQISATNGRYPGTLSKKIYGLKEQLSTYITCKTDIAGMVYLTWIPPQEDSGLYKGGIPTPSLVSTSNEHIVAIKTEYPVNPDNYGNITILNSSGISINTYADSPVKVTYVPVYGKDSSIARLNYPIVKGTVKVTIDNKEYTETQTDILESNQFFVDYANSLVSVKGRVANIYIEYLPSYVYVSKNNPNQILIFNKIFNSYSGSITLGYDFYVNLDVSIKDAAFTSTVKASFPLVVQNQLGTRSTSFNSIALEF